MHGEQAGCTPEQKIALDELHKRKIDLADEVLVLNVGGYIGESTRSEIEYARKLGKPVRYLESAANLPLNAI
jgi:cell division protein FtsB